MEKLSDVISYFVYYIILQPKKAVENMIDSYVVHRLDTKFKIASFLILITAVFLVLPVSIVYKNLGIENLLIYGTSYLLIMFISIIIADGTYKAVSKSKKSTNWMALELLELKKDEKLNILCDNLLSQGVFERKGDSLKHITHNEQPKAKINIIYKGGNGKVSYHAVFFLFSFLIKKDILRLEENEVSEILNFIQKNFLKNGNEIKYYLLEQSFKDWKNYKYSISNENNFINKFL